MKLKSFASRMKQAVDIVVSKYLRGLVKRGICGRCGDIKFFRVRKNLGKNGSLGNFMAFMWSVRVKDKELWVFCCCGVVLNYELMLLTVRSLNSQLRTWGKIVISKSLWSSRGSCILNSLMEIKELSVGNMLRKLCEFSAMGIRELTDGSISRELCEFPARGNVHKK